MQGANINIQQDPATGRYRVGSVSMMCIMKLQGKNAKGRLIYIKIDRSSNRQIQSWGVNSVDDVYCEAAGQETAKGRLLIYNNTRQRY